MMKLSLSLGLVLAVSHLYPVKSQPGGPGEPGGPVGPSFECQTAAQSANDPPELSYGLTCAEIVEMFPEAPTPYPEEDYRALCPFNRMNHRVGNLPRADEEEGSWNVLVADAIEHFQYFGTDADNFGLVTGITATGQLRKPLEELDANVDLLDIFRFWDIPGTSRDCGYTFSLGSEVVEPQVRAETLLRLAELSDDGRISLETLDQVLEENCRRDFQIHMETGIEAKDVVDYENETIIVGQAGITQMRLIYSYCGGFDQGYVLWTDVVRMLHARMPERKTKFLMTFALTGRTPAAANDTALL